MEKKKSQTRLGALDVFIIVAVAVCVICFAARYFFVKNSNVAENVQLDDYYVSFRVEGIKDSSAKKYMQPGQKFYLEETTTYFGSLCEGLTIKDAEKFYELDDGTVVKAENNAVGNLYRVDVDGTLAVKGKLDSNGSFLLNGNYYVGVNKMIKLYSKYLQFEVTITNIQKAQ